MKAVALEPGSAERAQAGLLPRFFLRRGEQRLRVGLQRLETCREAAKQLAESADVVLERAARRFERGEGPGLTLDRGRPQRAHHAAVHVERSCDARTVRYQSTVRRRPSSKLVCALNPKSRSARETSSCRRGCPFGFEASHSMAP